MNKHFEKAFEHAEAAFKEAEKAFSKIFSSVTDQLEADQSGTTYRFAAKSQEDRMKWCRKFMSMATEMMSDGKTSIKIKTKGSVRPQNN